MYTTSIIFDARNHPAWAQTSSSTHYTFFMRVTYLHIKTNEWKHRKFDKISKYRKKVFLLEGGGKVVSTKDICEQVEWKQI